MVIALGAAAFFVFGCLLVLVGSIGASLELAFGMGLEQIGLLAAVLSGGLGAGVVLAGPAVDRWPRRPLFVASAALAALAMGLASLAESFAAVAVGLAWAGFGAGAFETVLNATLSETSPDGRGLERRQTVGPRPRRSDARRGRGPIRVWLRGRGRWVRRGLPSDVRGVSLGGRVRRLCRVPSRFSPGRVLG